MKVLVTNTSLEHRTGSELWVQEMAGALCRKGHAVTCYSPRLGVVADAARAAGAQCIDHFADLPWTPDILHLQHHVEAMTALTAVPDVPALLVCHGWQPWEEIPLRHPRILRYAAVDARTQKWLIEQHQIPADRAQLLLNAVDLDRFQPREPLPARPRRALLVSNYLEPGPAVEALRGACRDQGLSFDAVGEHFGGAVANLETRLRDYDLVFACGRTALEAMVVGCAVVVCRPPDLGGMVTSDRFDRYRDFNFGSGVVQGPITARLAAAELEHYSATDADVVAQRVRAEAGLDAAAERLLGLYGQVIEAWRTEPVTDVDAERDATRDYLQWLNPQLRELQELRRLRRADRSADSPARASAPQVGWRRMLDRILRRTPR